MATTTGTLERLARTLGLALRQLEAEFDPGNVIAYFMHLGILFPERLATDGSVGQALSSVVTAAGALSGALSTLADAEQGGNPAAIVSSGVKIIDGIGTLLGALDAVAARIDEQADQWAPLPADEVQTFTSNFTEEIFADAVVRHLENERQEYLTAAVLLGVVDRFSVPVAAAQSGELPGLSRAFRFDRLVDAVTAPAKLFDTLYHWGQGTFDVSAFLERVQAVANLFSYNNVIDTSAGTPVLTTTLFTAQANTSTTPPGVDFVVDFPVAGGFTSSTTLGLGFSSKVAIEGDLAGGTAITLTAPSTLATASSTTVAFSTQLSRTPVAPDTTVMLLGQTGATRLEAGAINFSVGFKITADPLSGRGSGDVFFRVDLVRGKVVVDFSQGDGFLTKVTSGVKTEGRLDVGVTWSVAEGVRFNGAAELTIQIPLHVDLGPITLTGAHIALSPRAGSFPIELSARVHATLGPVQVEIDRIGLTGNLTFPKAPAPRGNLGPANLSIGFKSPTLLGLSLDAGPVTGGGFLSFEESAHRYAGGAELQVFGIAVKAFGLIETRLPDGSKGFSFVIVISAEFTPIQLGFGFTLLGVGGLVGINRGLDSEALAVAVRSGSLENLLFPRNPERDAPTIIHDLASVFPASPNHYVFGPMAKFGWGTPTLIDAEFGIVLELPGPRLSILGVAHMALPTKRAALLAINVAVAGTLDFPKKLFTIAASLYDSNVVGYRISGDMAFRLSFGDQPNFALALGGLNPSYQPPPGFPELRRLTVDLGINGNPSLTAQGYFALTSNTAQVGAAIDLHASGFGIDLNGHLGFDALFVFSPFSFVASFSAGVSVSFHGVGLGVGLNGSISGPTPWHVSAEACVSILFWDACLPIDFSFGTNTRAELPAMDPWTGNTDLSDASRNVTGLKTAIEDSGNWSGSFPAGVHPVVSLADAATRTGAPIDPVGQATLHQKVLPLNFRL